VTAWLRARFLNGFKLFSPLLRMPGAAMRVIVGNALQAHDLSAGYILSLSPGLGPWSLSALAKMAV